MSTNTVAKSEKGMDIAQDYDLTLLQSADIDDDGLIQKLEFAVGNVYEPAAGIYGGAVSPWFENATDAYAWCADNEAFLDGLYGDEPEPRQAQCTYCKRIVEVNEKTRREFIITPEPTWPMDRMYDGCRGWD